MNFATTVPWFRITSLSAIAALSLLSPVNAQPFPNPSNQVQPINPENPNNLRPSAQSSSLLSIDGGKRLMAEASSAVSAQNYPEAAKKLQEARQVFNQLSNFYQELNSSFSGIDNRVADDQRRKALETAQMRDEATYQLALVHRAQNKPELAVPLLVQIIKSQNPTRDLGKKAYQQLLELGFVDVPNSKVGDSTSSPYGTPSTTRSGNSSSSPRKKK
ncbi:MAG: hypothetical protein PUP93_03295 [Rhizonema sp. NSF051]|nr:hypothetical protein [Rhizonema sp. NSF051]